jgi:hypothetical protein
MEVVYPTITVGALLQTTTCPASLCGADVQAGARIRTGRRSRSLHYPNDPVFIERDAQPLRQTALTRTFATHDLHWRACDDKPGLSRWTRVWLQAAARRDGR